MRVHVAVIVVASAVVLCGCDPWPTASVENRCGYPVEMALTAAEGELVQRTIAVVADGGVWTEGEATYTPGVLLRSPGSRSWDHTLTWAEVERKANEDGVPYVLEGDLCPAEGVVPQSAVPRRPSGRG